MYSKLYVHNNDAIISRIYKIKIYTYVYVYILMILQALHFNSCLEILQNCVLV